MNYSADTCPCVLVFYTPYVLMTHFPRVVPKEEIVQRLNDVASNICV